MGGQARSIGVATRREALGHRNWLPLAEEALYLAHDYSHFETSFPMWHRDRNLAELISPTLVQFNAPGAARDRQVSAYQKGLRPKEGSFKALRAQKVKPDKIVTALFDTAIQTARRTGILSFEYGECFTLWRELMPEYEARVDAITRRAEALSLGAYTLASSIGSTRHCLPFVRLMNSSALSGEKRCEVFPV